MAWSHCWSHSATSDIVNLFWMFGLVLDQLDEGAGDGGAGLDVTEFPLIRVEG
jgi:hypothetical protein